MARTKKNRQIQMAPQFCGFTPDGLLKNSGKEVIITFAEYEALNLCDYELLTQANAAQMMNVSRPTFTRVYESARRKIAKAFIEGCTIKFEVGHSEIVEWHTCNECKISFTITNPLANYCPICKNPHVTQIN